jgi:hypothetical protein
MFFISHIADSVLDLYVFCSVADPDPGSEIRCLFDPWIRDPE